MTFTPPSIAWRGKLANLVAQVQAQKPQHGERQARMQCICGASLFYVVQSTGISRAHCGAACGVRWNH